MTNLTNDQKIALEFQLKRARDVSERNRLCVILGHNEGLSVEVLAKALRLSHSTVCAYLNDFDSTQKTQHAPKGGTDPKLSDDQSQELSKHLEKTTYLKVKDIRATVDANAMVDFFKGLENSSKATKIHVILDNAKANKNKKLEEYLAGSRIKVHYLPPYSPNLNPIERLWKMLRETKLYNRYYETPARFFHEGRNFFKDDVPKMLEILTSRITDNFQVTRLDPVKIYS